MKDILMLNETKVKPKSVIIEGSLHNRFKLFCKARNLKLGGVIEELISVYLDNPKEIQSMIDESHKINLEDFRKQR